MWLALLAAGSVNIIIPQLLSPSSHVPRSVVLQNYAKSESFLLAVQQPYRLAINFVIVVLLLSMPTQEKSPIMLQLCSIMLALCFMLFPPYYPKNYAGIMGTSLNSE